MRNDVCGQYTSHNRSCVLEFHAPIASGYGIVAVVTSTSDTRHDSIRNVCMTHTQSLTRSSYCPKDTLSPSVTNSSAFAPEFLLITERHDTPRNSKTSDFTSAEYQIETRFNSYLRCKFLYKFVLQKQNPAYFWHFLPNHVKIINIYIYICETTT